MIVLINLVLYIVGRLIADNYVPQDRHFFAGSVIGVIEGALIYAFS